MKFSTFHRKFHVFSMFFLQTLDTLTGVILHITSTFPILGVILPHLILQFFLSEWFSASRQFVFMFILQFVLILVLSFVLSIIFSGFFLLVSLLLSFLINVYTIHRDFEFLVVVSLLLSLFELLFLVFQLFLIHFFLQMVIGLFHLVVDRLTDRGAYAPNLWVQKLTFHLLNKLGVHRVFLSLEHILLQVLSPLLPPLLD